MLKKRVIPMLLLSDNRLVKGKKFKDFRETGMPESAIKIYSAQDSDELVLINIDRTMDGVTALERTLKVASKYCFMPLTVGGNIKEVSQIASMFRNGADKILLNTGIHEKESLAKEAIKLYGSQSIVGGLDYKKEGSKYLVYVNSGKINTGVDIETYAKKLEDIGVGELFINDIDRDGMLKGLNTDVISNIAEKLSIPVIACGGVGSQNDILEAFKGTQVSAVACSSIFCFGDHSPLRVRSFLKNSGIDVRRLK